MLTTENISIRDYTPNDFEAVKAIHESTQIDYKFPDINSPLFLVKRVVEKDGVVVAAGGLMIQVETYLWASPEPWADPQTKMNAIEAMTESGMHEAWTRGIDCACMWLPPGMESFGRHLKVLGFIPDRDGWQSYSRSTGAKK
jgi:hypothetical protein